MIVSGGEKEKERKGERGAFRSHGYTCKLGRSEWGGERRTHAGEVN